MFLKNKKDKPVSEASKEQNFISSGTTITGDVEAQGDFRIDGTVKGSVKTRGKVVVGKNGFILGDLKCEHVDIEGKIKGKLAISGAVNLRPSAFVEGEISTLQLAIAPGATFNASCDMKKEKGSEKEVAKEEEKKVEKLNPGNTENSQKTEKTEKSVKTAEKKIEDKAKKNERRPGQKGKQKQPT